MVEQREIMKIKKLLTQFEALSLNNKLISDGLRGKVVTNRFRGILVVGNCAVLLHQQTTPWRLGRCGVWFGHAEIPML